MIGRLIVQRPIEQQYFVRRPAAESGVTLEHIPHLRTDFLERAKMLLVGSRGVLRKLNRRAGFYPVLGAWHRMHGNSRKPRGMCCATPATCCAIWRLSSTDMSTQPMIASVRYRTESASSCRRSQSATGAVNEPPFGGACCERRRLHT